VQHSAHAWRAHRTQSSLRLGGGDGGGTDTACVSLQRSAATKTQHTVPIVLLLAFLNPSLNQSINSINKVSAPATIAAEAAIYAHAHEVFCNRHEAISET
jgi:hypothetical protein